MQFVDSEVKTIGIRVNYWYVEVLIIDGPGGRTSPVPGKPFGPFAGNQRLLVAAVGPGDNQRVSLVCAAVTQEGDAFTVMRKTAGALLRVNFDGRAPVPRTGTLNISPESLEPLVV